MVPGPESQAWESRSNLVTQKQPKSRRRVVSIRWLQANALQACFQYAARTQQPFSAVSAMK